MRSAALRVLWSLHEVFASLRSCKEDLLLPLLLESSTWFTFGTCRVENQEAWAQGLWTPGVLKRDRRSMSACEYLMVCMAEF